MKQTACTRNTFIRGGPGACCQSGGSRRRNGAHAQYRAYYACMYNMGLFYCQPIYIHTYTLTLTLGLNRLDRGKTLLEPKLMVLPPRIRGGTTTTILLSRKHTRVNQPLPAVLSFVYSRGIQQARPCPVSLATYFWSAEFE